MRICESRYFGKRHVKNGKTYHDAEPEMKREYLDLFFSKFLVKDGKIVAALPSDYIKPLIANSKILVRMRTNWGLEPTTSSLTGKRSTD